MTNKNTITIIISGHTGSGKTAITRQIAQMLTGDGLHVIEPEYEEGIEFVIDNQDKRYSAILEKNPIIKLEEKQLSLISL